MKKNLIVFFLSTYLWASPRALLESFQAALPNEVCRQRISDLDGFKLLFALPDFSTAFKKGDASVLKMALGKWSTDLLLKICLELDQDLAAACQLTPFLKSLSQTLKQEYLSRLEMPKATVDLFRPLVMHKNEREDVIRQLRKKKTNKPLETLYGQVQEVRGVWILGANSKLAEAIEAFISPLPPPFWDSRVLYRVLVTEDLGVAHYVPELATLVMSKQLLLEKNLLHSVVWLHELTHVAQKSVWVSERRDWKREFQVFSDWKRNDKKRLRATVKRTKKMRQDSLTELSSHSLFSLLPDEVVVGTGWFGVKPDGFVTEKSFTETMRQDDPSEDLADHVAIFHFVPERFCFEGKNIAPQKFEWVRENIFPMEKPTLSCAGK